MKPNGQCDGVQAFPGDSAVAWSAADDRAPLMTIVRMRRFAWEAGGWHSLCELIDFRVTSRAESRRLMDPIIRLIKAVTHANSEWSRQPTPQPAARLAAFAAPSSGLE